MLIVIAEELAVILTIVKLNINFNQLTTNVNDNLVSNVVVKGKSPVVLLNETNNLQFVLEKCKYLQFANGQTFTIQSYSGGYFEYIGYYWNDRYIVGFYNTGIRKF